MTDIMPTNPALLTNSTISTEQNDENERRPYTVGIKVLHRKMLREIAEHEQRDIAVTLERIIEAHYRAIELTALLPEPFKPASTS